MSTFSGIGRASGSWRNNPASGPRRGALPALCVTIILALSGVCEQAIGMDQDSDLAKWGAFLQQTTPVKRLVYSEPSHISVNGAPLEGTLTYECAFQDETFYWRNLTNFPGHPKHHPFEGMVVGLCPGRDAGQYWCIQWLEPQGVVSIAPRQVPRRIETVSNAETYGPYAERDMFPVRSLGLIGLAPKSFVWIDDRHFKARVYSTKWPLDTATAELTGEVVRLDENSRPLVLKLTCPEYFKRPPSTYIARYTYADLEPRWFPSEITTSAPDGRNAFTLKILAVELGRADLPPDGYTPGMFLPETAEPEFFFVSNGVQHVFTPAGPVATPRPKPPQVSPLRLAVLGALVAVISTYFLVRLYVRRRRAGADLSK